MSITYCSKLDCVRVLCPYNQFTAPKGQDISIADRDDGCYQSAFIQCSKESRLSGRINREDLLLAICKGTQRTPYKCDDVCKAMCGSDGHCAYCSIIADSIEELNNA